MKRFKILIPAALIAAFCLTIPRPRYQLAIGAIFQNEARFLAEWIEYHKLVGVDHFYLYNNLSKDDYLSVLQPYIERGLVELYDWPHKSTTQKDWNPIQCAAYNHLITKRGHETKWLAVIDTDEFIVPVVGNSIPPLLKEYEGCGGLAINWQLFGTSNVQRIPEGKTLIGTLTKRAPRKLDGNRFVKTICRPRRVRLMKKPHNCKYKKPFFHVTELGRPFRKKSLTDAVCVDKIRIHHYTYRDEEFFNQEKKQRILQWFPERSPEPNPELNKVEDRTIARFVPDLEEALFNRSR